MKKTMLALFTLLTMSTATADMVVVISPAATFSEISLAQLTRIFLGQTGTFPDGSKAVPLDVNGDRSRFYSDVLKRSPEQMEKYWARMIFTGKSQPPREITARQVKSLVGDMRGAISYMDSAEVDASVRVLRILKD